MKNIKTLINEINNSQYWEVENEDNGYLTVEQKNRVDFVFGKINILLDNFDNEHSLPKRIVNVSFSSNGNSYAISSLTDLKANNELTKIIEPYFKN